MKVLLDEVPQKPVILQGFPGFGLIGTIATEYILEQLETRQIGAILVDELPPMVAVHQGKVIPPISIHYCEKYNLIVLHIIVNLKDVEWQFANAILELVERTNAWEVMSIEGIMDPSGAEESQLFSYALRAESSKKLEQIGIKQLQEGIVQGIAGGLILHAAHREKLTSLFATTHSQMPDSQASVKVIEALDKYLGLAIDTAPLAEKAAAFEEKFKAIADSANQVMSEKEKKNMSYVG